MKLNGEREKEEGARVTESPQPQLQPHLNSRIFTSSRKNPIEIGNGHLRAATVNDMLHSDRALGRLFC